VSAPLRIVKSGLSEAEWVAGRRNYIGASDAAAAVGLSPYKTPYQLWLEKTGQVEPDDLSHNEAVQWGKRLEDMLADYFEQHNKTKLRRSNFILQHPALPWMACNVDRMIVSDERGPGIWEGKTAGVFAARDAFGEGEDHVPEHYLIQMHHMLAVTGYKWGVLSVLIGGQRYKQYDFRRDDDFEALLIGRELAFWKHVESEAPPDIKTEADARLRWPSSNEQRVEATPAIMEAVLALATLQAQGKAMDEQSESLRAQIMAHMGDAELLTLDGRKLCSWKTQSAKRFDSSAFKAAHPALYAEHQNESITRVFRMHKS